MNTDVVVTGLGAITPLGADVESSWEALLLGKPGITAINVSDDRHEVPAIPAGRLAVEPAELLPVVETKRLDRSQQSVMIAAREAWAHAGSPDVDPERFATVIGTGIGGVDSLLDQDDVLETQGIRRVSPRTVPLLMPNAAASVVSIEFNSQAGVFTPVSACSSGAEALAMGARLIRAGEADIVIAGGTEAAINPLTIAGFLQARAMSRDVENPGAASRPFTADRDGFVLGEGAGVVVLESAEHAAKRGAKVIAVLAGAGIASDAHHVTAPAPDGRGQISAMHKALRQAGLEPSDVKHVNAHATSTPVGDAGEAVSIESVFGSIPVTAPKASMGHLLGAAGAVEAIFAILSVSNDLIPPTLNVTEEKLDPAINVDVVTETRHGGQDVVLSNSFGFGGQNVSLIFARPQD